MSKNILDNLFGSRTRVKVLKFIFRKFPSDFSLHELFIRTQEPKTVLKSELISLSRASLLRKKHIAGKRGERYVVNATFPFLGELRTLILKSLPAEKDRMIARIANLGRVRLAITSGVFSHTHDTDSFNAVADLLIVGDDISKRKLNLFLRSLEAEVGTEIKFTLMDKDEFVYRYSMFDRFVRVLLEGPHEKLINKLGL